MSHCATSLRSKQVGIIYKYLPKYRAEFFELLRQRLDSDNIELVLYHGDPGREDRAKGDRTTLDWAQYRPNFHVRLGAIEAVWQPRLLRELWSADLVIAEQANKLIVNYFFLLTSKMKIGPPFCLWGHGANLQAEKSWTIREKVKRVYSRWPDWWFAYTEECARRIERLGYPSARVSVVQNSIDTKSLQHGITRVTEVDRKAFRDQHRLTESRTAIYIGSLYPAKRIEFLLEAAEEIHRMIPDFTLLVAGDGADRGLVEQYALRKSGVVYLGRVDGVTRTLALDAAAITLMPGLVGLAVIDAFVARAPMVTIDARYHSPEIEYLVDSVNGLLLEEGTSSLAYASAVVTLLEDPERLAYLQLNCGESAEKFTVEEMVSRFSAGVKAALEG